MRRILTVGCLVVTALGASQSIRFEDMHGRRISDWKPNQKIRVRLTGEGEPKLYGIWWGYRSQAIAPQILWWGKLADGESRTIVVATGTGLGKVSCNVGPFENLAPIRTLLRNQR